MLLKCSIYKSYLKICHYMSVCREFIVLDCGTTITCYQACNWDTHKGLQSSTIVSVFKPSKLLAEGVATKEGGFYAHIHAKTPSCTGRFCRCEAPNFEVTFVKSLTT